MADAKVIQAAAPNHFTCYLHALIFDNLLPTTSALFYPGSVLAQFSILIVPIDFFASVVPG
jgi:hypothetical protein